MKPLDRYIEEVMRNVFAAPEDRKRLEADLRAHFAEAEAAGEPAGRILEGLGRPQDVAAAFNAERELRHAGFWRRLVAFAGDLGILLALAVPVVAVAVLVQAGRIAPGLATTALLVTLGLGAVGVLVFYFPLLEARFGRTLGKHLLRIRVVRENGSPIGLGQAFVRRLSLYFDMLVIDALFIPFTDRSQRALDVVAKTVVAREPGETVPGWRYAVCLLLPVAALLALVATALLCAPA